MARLSEYTPQVSARQAGFPAAGFSGRSDRMEINAYESMDAGLTIKTREGDIVTLSTSRFSELSAGEYSRQGTLATEDGQVSARQHVRSIQLASGETFAFSVQGDLNEAELADIEDIVAGIDEIIGEMADGDMDDAFALAMSMGSYDSVARYEADITMTRSYSAYAQTQAMTQGRPGFAAPELPQPMERPAVAGMPFMDRVAELLEAQEEKALAHARQPLSRLFDHYLSQVEAEDGEKAPAAHALERAARSVDQMIQEMIKDIFDNTLDQMI